MRFIRYKVIQIGKKKKDREGGQDLAKLDHLHDCVSGLGQLGDSRIALKKDVFEEENKIVDHDGGRKRMVEKFYYRDKV